MAYTPKTWVCGEVITAEDMNHIEEGIAENCGSCNEPLLLTATYDEVSGDYTFDQTWQEVHDALLAGRRVLWTSGDSITEPDKAEQYYCVKTEETNGVLVAYLLEWNVISGEVRTNHLPLEANTPSDNLRYRAIA